MNKNNKVRLELVLERLEEMKNEITNHVKTLNDLEAKWFLSPTADEVIQRISDELYLRDNKEKWVEE